MPYRSHILPASERPSSYPQTEGEYLRMDERIARREARYGRRLEWDEFDDGPRKLRKDGRK